MIELYHNDMSVCAQKVRFALAEKKLTWEGHHLNLRAGDQLPEWYDRLRERRAYSEALEKWFNPSYLSLMKENGSEVKDRVKAIIG